MKRVVSLITVFALALQTSGLALAASIPRLSRPEKMTYDTGAYALYTYDGRSRIKAVEHKNSSHTLLRKETNTYDPASRITSRYEGPASGGVTTTFGYDDAGQLTSESSSGYSASYTYDANGNRTNRTVNGVSETYTVDDSDKLTSVTWSQGGNNYAKEYAYHWSGRPTSITYKTNGGTTATETMTWDKESRMLTNSLANASYVYNGFDTRVSKTVSSTTTTFKRAGADPVSPVLADTVGGTTTNHLPGISSRTGGTSTFSHSGIKNGILQTNSSQSNTATKRYDAFGNELSTSGTWQSRFDYGGGFSYQRDDESGYKLLGHRYYDPEIGRFLTRDPIKDGRNWYVYCENDPISGADPTGLYDESIRDMIEKLITAGELDPGSGEMYRTDPVLQKKIELEFGDMKIHGGGLTNADASMTQAEKNDAITRVVKGHKPSWKSNKLRRTRGFINLKGLKFFGKVFKGLALVTLVLEGPEAAARDLVFADEIEALAGAGGGIVNDALDKAASDVEDGYRRRAGFSEDEWAEYF